MDHIKGGCDCGGVQQYGGTPPCTHHATSVVQHFPHFYNSPLLPQNQNPYIQNPPIGQWPACALRPLVHTNAVVLNTGYKTVVDWFTPMAADGNVNNIKAELLLGPLVWVLQGGGAGCRGAECGGAECGGAGCRGAERGCTECTCNTQLWCNDTLLYTQHQYNV